MYLVIFCYWVGPVPYLELFGAGPVEKNTLYVYLKHDQSYLRVTPASGHVGRRKVSSISKLSQVVTASLGNKSSGQILTSSAVSSN